MFTIKQLQIHFFPCHIENFVSIHFVSIHSILPLAIPSQQQDLFLTSDSFTLFPGSCQKPSHLLLLLLFPYSTVLLTHSPILVNQDELLYVHLVQHCYRVKGKMEGEFPPAQDLLPSSLLEVICLPKMLLFCELWCKVQAKSICRTVIPRKVQTQEIYRFSKL